MDVETILRGVGIVLGTGAATFIMYLKRHSDVDRSKLSRELDRDQQVNALLRRIIYEMGAKRAYVSVLKDFIQEPLSGSKLRMYEVAADGVNYQSHAYQNLPLSLVPDEVALILQPGPSFTQVSALPDGRLKWLCRMGDTSAIARATIWRGREPKAFVGADFGSNDHGDFPEPKNIDKLCEYAGRIDLLMYDV